MSNSRLSKDDIRPFRSASHLSWTFFEQMPQLIFHGHLTILPRTLAAVWVWQRKSVLFSLFDSSTKKENNQECENNRRATVNSAIRQLCFACKREWGKASYFVWLKNRRGKSNCQVQCGPVRTVDMAINSLVTINYQFTSVRDSVLHDTGLFIKNKYVI